MKLLALDPSSTATGYAVLDGDTLLDAGKLLPKRTRDDANERILAMASDLPPLIDEFKPDAVVFEDTSGKVSRRHGAGGGAGLAVHGKAIGFLWRQLLLYGAPVHAVKENDWTRGTSKASRVAWCRAAYPKQYDPAQDKGGDVADAIKLGRWFIETRRAAAPEANP